MGNWLKIGYEALEEGMAKAIAGEPGTQQDDSQATYAAPYTEDELWLDWNDTVRDLQLKHMGLTGQAKAKIDGKAYAITSLQKSENRENGEAGRILSQDDSQFVIQVADGTVEVQVAPLEE